jgi:hypothetical protein
MVVMNRMPGRRFVIVPFALLVASAPASIAQSPRFEVSVSSAVASQPVTGRLVLLISKAAQPEPRLALSLRGPVAVGLDIEQVRPDQPVIVDDAAIAYPVKLSAIPPGDYFVQAVVNVYDQVRRADGKTVWLPMNDGTIECSAAAARTDTEWIKYVSIQSKKLTQFWGRPIFIHAAVLLPKGYAEHPNTWYPSVYTLGHSWTPLSFRTTAPTGAAAAGGINPVTGLENGYETYRQWSGDGFPRGIAISLIQQTPYFPDSYSVNSANNGPYGDAIVEEVIPYLEERFRIIRKPYARHLEGASTSGWQALALQLRNPDFFGGAWVLQPDPIDFTRYVSTNIYEDTNAFVLPLGPFLTAERGFQRLRDGQTIHTLRQLSLFEAVLGSRGRSGFQLGAWEAVYGPTDKDAIRAALGQAHRNDRPQRRDLHARQRLRLARVCREELGDSTEGRGQAALLQRRHGRLLAEPRGLQVRGVSQVDDEPEVGC